MLATKNNVLQASLVTWQLCAMNMSLDGCIYLDYVKDLC